MLIFILLEIEWNPQKTLKDKRQLFSAEITNDFQIIILLFALIMQWNPLKMTLQAPNQA